MKIDRHNYEEYFILYLDNELGDADRRMVESFIELHPDLREELDLLSQFKLVPEPDIIFSGKSSLLKGNAGSKTISTEELMLYMDRELSPVDQEKVRFAIAADPGLQKEFSSLQATRLVADRIPFPDKSVLYRRNETVRLTAFRWYRVAAAVFLLLLAGTVIILLNNNRQQKAAIPEVAETRNQAAEEVSATNDITQETPLANDHITEEQKEIVPATDNRDNSPVRINKQPKPEQAIVNNPRVTPAQEQQLPIQENSNNLPEPSKNRKALAATDNRPGQTVDPETNFSNNTVTSISPQPLNIVQASVPVMDDADQEPTGGKKNKLRGILRKVTRTFEKRTNIDATDDDERLLVAGLAIKLK